MKWTRTLHNLPLTTLNILQPRLRVCHILFCCFVVSCRRTTKVPNRDLIRLFIRCFAKRGGYSAGSPWVVQADMAKKYHIKNKLADLFVSPRKVSKKLSHYTCILTQHASLPAVGAVTLRTIYASASCGCFCRWQTSVEKLLKTRWKSVKRQEQIMKPGEPMSFVSSKIIDIYAFGAVCYMY